MEKIKSILVAHKVLFVLLGVLVVGGAIATAGTVGNIYVEGDYNAYETPAGPQEQQEPNEELGAVSGNEFQHNSILINGLEIWGQGKPLNSATTTVCAIQSPNATSTLIHGGLADNTGSTTAFRVTLAKSTDQYSTSTLLGDVVSISANTKFAQVATTTDAQINAAANTFAPNEWFVVSYQPSGGVGTFSPSGSCSAQWLKL